MQPTITQNTTVEKVEEISSEWIRVVPLELVNIVPESIWLSLSVDQKKEMLRQHNIYEKYVGGTVESPIEQAQTGQVVVESNNPGIIVEQEQRAEKNPEFEKALAEFKVANEEKPKEETEKSVLSQEDLNRIKEENASKVNTQPQTYNFFGYQPSQTVFSNAAQTSQSGNVSDASTWASTLIAKIFSLFQ